MLLLDQVLVEQAQIVQDAHSHTGIHAGLKSKQDVEVEPAVIQAQMPDDIVLTVSQVVCHIAATGNLKGIKLKQGDPGFMHKAHQQVTHYLGVREQKLVAVVVLGHVSVALAWISQWVSSACFCMEMWFDMTAVPRC